MTSVRRLMLVHGAGEPDDVPAKRIDLVQAAVRFYDAMNKGADLAAIDATETKFFTAVAKYKAAVKRRRREQTA